MMSSRSRTFEKMHSADSDSRVKYNAVFQQKLWEKAGTIAGLEYAVIFNG